MNREESIDRKERKEGKSPPKDMIALLWKIIARLDDYIRAADTKAAVVASMNVFILGLIILRWEALDFGIDALSVSRSAQLLALGALSGLVSFGTTGAAAMPYLFSPSSKSDSRSILFFGDVAKHANGGDYLLHISSYKPDDLERELASQAHALSVGASRKYRFLKYAVWTTISALILTTLSFLGAN